MRFYLRYAARPRWAEDYPTYIALGHWCHLWNTRLGEWFRAKLCRGSGPPERPGCYVRRISLRTFLAVTGWPGFVEVLEDYLRWRPLSPRLDRKRPKPPTAPPFEPPRVWGGIGGNDGSE